MQCPCLRGIRHLPEGLAQYQIQHPLQDYPEQQKQPAHAKQQLLATFRNLQFDRREIKGNAGLRLDRGAGSRQPDRAGVRHSGFGYLPVHQFLLSDLDAQSLDEARTRLNARLLPPLKSASRA